MTVNSGGCVISCDGVEKSFAYDGVLAGFATSANGDIVHASGAVLSLGGTAFDFTCKFYAVEESEKTYRSGVLGFFQRTWDSITALPSNIASSLRSMFDDLGDALTGLPAKISDALTPAWLSELSFQPIVDLVQDSFEKLTSFFGLSDLLDDPDSPFAWLEE